MMRKSALVVGVLCGSLVAGRLLAQDSSNAKPASPSVSMPHMPAATAAKPMHQDSARVSSPQPGAQHAMWTREQVKEAQQGLAKAGYFKGKANGAYGRQTRKAIREYQKANKLPVTGRLDQDLLRRLRSA